MFIDKDYSASVYSLGFASGVVYTANNFLSVFRDNFSYSQASEDISNYRTSTKQEKLTSEKLISDDLLLKLNWPITIILEQDDEYFIASNEDLNIHGMGSSEQEALTDFNRSFIHFWKYYEDIKEDDVIGYAKRLKVLFNEIVREIHRHANSKKEN